MNSPSFLIVGGDLRSYYLASMLKEKYSVTDTYNVPHSKNTISSINNFKYIICPIPFTRDGTSLNTDKSFFNEDIDITDFCNSLNENHIVFGGNIPNDVKDLLSSKNISCFDINTFDSLKYANGYLTSEGLLKDIVESTPFSISHSNILVVGYGKCGAPICRHLNALGANIFVYNRSYERQVMAISDGFTLIKDVNLINLNDYDIIINTIPKNIFTNQSFEKISKEVFVFEISKSSIGSTLLELKNKNIHYKNCPGIPGKTAPLSAAKIIFDTINSTL